MKTICRIWLIALIIQPILFSFVFASLGGLIIIPFELIGSIPGIVAFGLLMQLLIKSRIDIIFKWYIIIILAITTAFFASYFVYSLLDSAPMKLTVHDLPILSLAPASAVLSIIFNCKSVNEDLKNEPLNDGFQNHPSSTSTKIKTTYL